ncbi:hypothetical protein V8D89_014568 [Ganoderma adspersum]
MSSDPFSHVRPRSPTPLALWPTKAQASPNKGKKPVYPHRSWVRGRDPSPATLDSNAASPVKPSLLARISDPADSGQEEDPRGDSSGDAEGADQREWMEGVEEIGEVLEVSVAGEKSQDELPTQTVTSGIRVKTEETAVIIPSPTRSEFSAGRKRGSRSTIDVFGEPTVPLETDRRNSMTISPKEEEMTVDFSSNGVIDVDAFLATVSPVQHKTPLVSSPPPVSPPPSTSANQTPTPLTTIAASTSPVPASGSNSTPSLQSLPYPQAVLDQCRNILIPLVERNAKLRKPGVDEQAVKRKAAKLLSDKLCADFIKLAKQVREQISVQAPPRRPQSTEAQKRGREGSNGSPGPPRKVVKLESPKEVGFNDVVAMASPSSPPPVPPTEDIQMDEVIENIASKHPSEPPLVSGTGVDVILPPSSSREPSAALPLGPGSGADQEHLGIGSPEGGALEASSPSNSLLAPPSSNTEPGPMAVVLPASRPPSHSPSPQANDASTTDVAEESGATTHEVEQDHAASDTSGLDAECVRDILDATPEDEQVAYPPIDDMRHEQSVDVPEPPVVHSPCLIPGVWQAVVGQPSSRIEEIHFFVDDATGDAIERWSQRHESFSPNERHVEVHLLCVSYTAVEAILRDPGLTPEAIADGLFNSQSDWPGLGQLVVGLNTNSNLHELDSEPDPKGKSWIVQRPTPWTTHLDITSHVRRGHNTLSLIQLAGLSDRMFVIHAAEPSEEEKAGAYIQATTWQNIKKRPLRSPLSSPRNAVAKTSPKSSPAPVSGASTPPGTLPTAA